MEQASRSLDGLPPELLTLILVQIPSARDLHSLIRASAQCYRIFVLSKKRVLSSLVHHVFLPDVLREAYHVVKASCFDARGGQMEQVVQFMETFDDDLPWDTPEALIPLSMSIQILQLHRSLDYFVQDFARRSIPALQNCALALDLEPSQDPQTSPDLEGKRVILSSVEEGRLSRAFCRFELYGHLFFTEAEDQKGDIHTNTVSHLTAEEQANIFFSRLAPWRIEEIACVRDYLVGRLDDLFNRVEDDYVKSVISERFKGVAAVRSIDTFCHRGQDLRDIDRADITRFDNFEGLEGNSEDEGEDYEGPDRFELDDHFFSQWARLGDQEAYMEYMLSLGLSFLRNLFELEGEDRRRLVVSNALLGSDFLTNALESDPPGQTRFSCGTTGTRYDSKYIFTGDNILEPNEAWIWSKRMKLSSRWDFHQGREWRPWGFVFWDSSRLGASKILSKKYICPLIYPGYLALAANFLHYSPWEVKRSESYARSRSTEPSAEERLKLMRPLFKPEGLAPVKSAHGSETSTSPES